MRDLSTKKAAAENFIYFLNVLVFMAVVRIIKFIIILTPEKFLRWVPVGKVYMKATQLCVSDSDSESDFGRCRKEFPKWLEGIVTKEKNKSSFVKKGYIRVNIIKAFVVDGNNCEIVTTKVALWCMFDRLTIECIQSFAKGRYFILIAEDETGVKQYIQVDLLKKKDLLFGEDILFSKIDFLFD